MVSRGLIALHTMIAIVSKSMGTLGIKLVKVVHVLPSRMVEVRRV